MLTLLLSVVYGLLPCTTLTDGSDILLTVHLSIFILVNNQLDAQNVCFTISLFHASTCFEHHVPIIRRSKLYYKASVFITPIGVMIPEAVKYNDDFLMMGTWCSKHVEA